MPFFSQALKNEEERSIDMTKEELAGEIAKGLIETGVEGGYDAISRSTAGDYPSIGCSQWEGGRANALLERIPGGTRFMHRSYSNLKISGELPALAGLLASSEGQAAQLELLSNDCLTYVSALQTVPTLDDSRCLIYAGIWCPTSHYVVSTFLKRRYGRGYNLRSLKAMRDMFYNEYAAAAGCSEYAAGYANRAERTYQYVASIDLTTLYGVPVYGEGPFGR